MSDYYQIIITSPVLAYVCASVQIQCKTLSELKMCVYERGSSCVRMRVCNIKLFSSHPWDNHKEGVIMTTQVHPLAMFLTTDEVCNFVQCVVKTPNLLIVKSADEDQNQQRADPADKDLMSVRHRAQLLPRKLK